MVRKDPILKYLVYPELVGESYDYFKEELKKKAPNTRYEYTRHLCHYLVAMETDTEKLYAEVNDILKGSDRRKIKQFESKLNKYCTDFMLGKYDLKGKKYEDGEIGRQYKKNTVRNRSKALQFFFTANMLPYKYKMELGGEIKDDIETRELLKTEGKDALTLDEIRQYMELTGNPRNHSIITMLKDTGLRVGDIAELRIKNVKEVIEDPSKEFHAFEITPIKNLRNDDPLPANPVMGSDSCHYLRRWIDYARSKHGKHLELKDEAYVYFKVKSGRARTFPDGSDYSAYAMFEPLDNKVISGLFANIKRKNKDKFRTEISAHSFRKTHMTRLQAGGVPERWINIMHGRAGQGTQGIYSKPDYEMLTSSYMNAYPFLSFNVSAQAFDKVMEDQENIKTQMEESTRQIEILGKAVELLQLRNSRGWNQPRKETQEEQYHRIKNMTDEELEQSEHFNDLLKDPEIRSILSKKRQEKQAEG